MGKYIDADKLKAEIERMRKINRKAFEADHIESDIFHGRTQAINHLFEFITSLQQEQSSEDLEKAAEEYGNKEFPDEPALGRWGTGDYEPPVDNEYPREIAKEAFIAGAEWQKEQFEKNRLAACDAQTREEYERETDFVDKFLTENPFCTPTFSDAINYGIAWQKEQMMKDAVESNVVITSKGILLSDLLIEDFNYEDKVRIVELKAEEE